MLRFCSSTMIILGMLACGGESLAQSRFQNSIQGGPGGTAGFGGAQPGGRAGNQGAGLQGTGGLGGQGAAGGRAGGNALGAGAAGGARGAGGMGRAGGQGAAGANGMAGQTQFNLGDGSLGQTIGQGNFVGQGDNGGGFVGERFSGQQTRGGTGPQFGNMQQGRMQNGFRPQNGGFQNGAAGQMNRRQLRPRVRLGFQPAEVSPPPVRQNAVADFASLPTFRGRSLDVDVNVEANGTAVLSGRVATEHERRLLESFLRLEPGIRQVRNELEVSAP